MNQCEECNKDIKLSETYLVKAKYGDEPFTNLCEECSFNEYRYYVKNNIRCVVVTPSRGDY